VTSAAEIKLWGRTIGAVTLAEGDEVAVFEYDPAFSKSGIGVSPLCMPLSTHLYTFPELPRKAFRGLPGLLADSLPDKYGNALINQWLANQGRKPDSFNAVERLCYIGKRGMGALEFAPGLGPNIKVVRNLQVDKLVELASEILTQREGIMVSFADREKKQALTELLQVGTSAGGARAKAVIAWNPQTNEVRSGQVPAGDGFEYWLLKFDGVKGNRDKEMDDPLGYGAIEYACYLMARDCGIEMTECRLFEENDRRHFMTRRYDRQDDGAKLHKQSLAALAHFDFNLAGAYSYEQAMMTIRQLGLPMQSIEEQFRRMVFNITIRNQDDHVKNIEFLMDKSGNWRLSPAFDMTYSYNPVSDWTSTHQMTMNGKRDDFTMDDFRACAKTAALKRGRGEAIIEDVRAVVSHWRDYADDTGVPAAWRDRIQKTLRMAYWS
jgi:serine/threonine-protein kinase HipA